MDECSDFVPQVFATIARSTIDELMNHHVTQMRDWLDFFKGPNLSDLPFEATGDESIS